MLTQKNEPAETVATGIELAGNLAAAATMVGLVFVAPLAGAYMGFTTGVSHGLLAATAMGIGGAAAGGATGFLALLPIAGASALIKKAAHMTIVPTVRALTASVRFGARMANKLDVVLSDTTPVATPVMPSSLTARSALTSSFQNEAGKTAKSADIKHGIPELPSLPTL